MSPLKPRLPPSKSQHHVINTANPRGTLDDGVEYRLHVGRRAAVMAEHLGGRRLVLQRLAQFRVVLNVIPRTAARSRWRSRFPASKIRRVRGRALRVPGVA